MTHGQWILRRKIFVLKGHRHRGVSPQARITHRHRPLGVWFLSKRLKFYISDPWERLPHKELAAGILPTPELHCQPPQGCAQSPSGGQQLAAKGPCGVGWILLVGPSPKALQPCCPQCSLSPGTWPWVLSCLPPTESGLGPDYLVCVSLSESPRAASPSVVLQVEPAGLDTAPGRICSMVGQS